MLDNIHALFLSTDSLVSGLGRSQIWNYLCRLSAADVELTVLTWEPSGRGDSSWRQKAERELAQEAYACSVRWIRIRRSARLGKLGVLWDGWRSSLIGLWVVVRYRITILHARSDVAMAMAWLIRRLTGAKTLYDMRGFWADERLDGGLWREGRLYRMVRKWEDRWVQQADGVVVLTAAAAKILNGRFPQVPISVIPTAVDLKRFIPLPSEQHSTKGWTVVYSGSLGTWQALDEIVAFFLAVCRRLPESRLVIVTPEPAKRWYPRLLEHGLDASQLIVDMDPAPNTVARRIASADVGLACYRRIRSAAGCSPVKVGEYLACGVPVAVSAGIGDCDALLARWRAGVTVSANAWDEAVDALDTLRGDPALPARCRALAEAHFSLNRASQQYLRLYQRLTGETHGLSSGTPEESRLVDESGSVAPEYDKAIT